MLIRFRVKNFLSFNNEIELSMVAGKAQKHAEHVVIRSSPKDVDLLRSALIYGANASGKSNVVKAIDFARRMVIDSVKAKSSIPRKPFKLDPNCSNSPSRFEFEIKYKGKLFTYGFSLDSKRVYEEWLLEIRSSSEKVLFRRTTTSDDTTKVQIGVKVSKKDMSLFELVALGTPPNRLYLHECVERNIKHFADVYEWFENVLLIIFPNSMHPLAQIGFENETHFGDNLINYLEKFGTGICGYQLEPISDPSSELPKEIIEDLEQTIKDDEVTTIFNPNLQRYYVTKENEQIKVFKLLLRHKDETCNSDAWFDMDEESDGTLRLLDLIPLLFRRKEERESVVIIDELDRSLHPILSYEFISDFLQSKGPNQIIVTTHEANLLDLDLLRRDEIWFVEKDHQGSSSVYSLEEFAPRYDKDIRKGYILGRFGAIPMISNLDLSEE